MTATVGEVSVTGSITVEQRATAPAVHVSPTSVQAGDTLTISGVGWSANSVVTVTVKITGIAPVQIVTTAAGTFEAWVTIPSSTPADTYTVTVQRAGEATPVVETTVTVLPANPTPTPPPAPSGPDPQRFSLRPADFPNTDVTGGDFVPLCDPLLQPAGSLPRCQGLEQRLGPYTAYHFWARPRDPTDPSLSSVNSLALVTARSALAREVLRHAADLYLPPETDCAVGRYSSRPLATSRIPAGARVGQETRFLSTQVVVNCDRTLTRSEERPEATPAISGYRRGAHPDERVDVSEDMVAAVAVIWRQGQFVGEVTVTVTSDQTRQAVNEGLMLSRKQWKRLQLHRGKS